MSDEKEECINKIVDNLYHHPVIMGGQVLSKEILKKKIENVDNEVVKNKVTFNK